ncbi:MAG: hypothetical protein II852_15900 [Bacteroidales bacterium]|nr:hypothetical protein [Bacteroidales bacterium]
MGKNINLFFNKFNSIPYLDNADYTQIDLIIQIAESIVNMTGLGVYIFDYHKKGVIYLSKNIPKWFGLPDTICSDYEAYLQYIPEEDFNMLVEINNAVFEFWSKLSTTHYEKYTVSYDFRFKGFMVHQHYAPLFIDNGKIWLSMCIVSLSARKKTGNVIMNASDSNFHYEYSLKSKRWMPKKNVSLTEREKNIIRFCAQGLSVKQIAEIVSVGYETIKSQKKKIFEKLGVTSVEEMVSCAMNDCLM